MKEIDIIENTLTKNTLKQSHQTMLGKQPESCSCVWYDNSAAIHFMYGEHVRNVDSFFYLSIETQTITCSQSLLLDLGDTGISLHIV